MSSDQTPAGIDPVEYAKWRHDHERKAGQLAAKRGEGMEWKDVLDNLASLPPETPEERADRERRIIAQGEADRLASFRKICPPEFMERVNRARLTDGEAFDQVAAWSGKFPGIIASGPTGSAKTRSCWSALGRLNVREGRSFAWFPVKRMVTEFQKFESKDLADEFWKWYSKWEILVVDDLDKINWQFNSEPAALFQFYDWIYREKRPCLTTTNHGRNWWSDKMGDAFARRLFDDAHVAVNFR
jgi:DNA replication protein DnaC